MRHFGSVYLRPGSILLVKARALLVEEGLIGAVISLPANLLRNPALPMILLVLEHGRKAIRMVDATDLSVRGRRWNTMGADEICEVLARLEVDSVHSADIPVEAVIAADCELNPARYLAKEIEMTNPTPLVELAHSIDRGISFKAVDLDNLGTGEDTGISYLPVSEVGFGRVGSNLPHLAELDVKLERARLADGDLVVTKTSMPIRAAVADAPEGKTVIASGNLFIVRLDKVRVDPYFLAAFFASKDGEQVLSRIVRGSALLTISVSGLRDLNVPLPPMEVQKRIAARFKGALDEIAALESEIEGARVSAASAYGEEMLAIR